MKPPTEKQLLRQAAKSAIKKAHVAGLATTHGDDRGVYRLLPDGSKEYLNPPLEAVQATAKAAIDRIHAAGLPTTHCDARGRVYDLLPNGTKIFRPSTTD